MMTRGFQLALPLLACFFPASVARAHCDGLDGPVAIAARKALDAGEPRLVLIWVQPEHEKEVRDSLIEARKVRALGPEARALADRAFMDTIVRLHRAGEGEPYTGLKPAGRDLGPAIPATDRAVASGKPEGIIELLTRELDEGIRARFGALQAARSYAPDDVEAGRRYVSAYVALLHYVENAHTAAGAAPYHGAFPGVHHERPAHEIP